MLNHFPTGDGGRAVTARLPLRRKIDYCKRIYNRWGNQKVTINFFGVAKKIYNTMKSLNKILGSGKGIGRIIFLYSFFRISFRTKDWMSSSSNMRHGLFIQYNVIAEGKILFDENPVYTANYVHRVTSQYLDFRFVLDEFVRATLRKYAPA